MSDLAKRLRNDQGVGINLTLCREAADEIERVRAQVAALREAASTYDAAMQAIGGCGDGGCVVVKPVGQHTNGGCRCMRDQIKSQRVARAANALRAALATGGDDD